MILLLISMMLSGNAVHADVQEVDLLRREIAISATGSASGMCDGYTFVGCSTDLSHRAEWYGQLDAERECRSYRGNLVGRPYCSTYCSPLMAPPAPSGPVYTSCDARCSATCVVDE